MCSLLLHIKKLMAEGGTLSGKGCKRGSIKVDALLNEFRMTSGYSDFVISFDFRKKISVYRVSVEMERYQQQKLIRKALEDPDAALAMLFSQEKNEEEAEEASEATEKKGRRKAPEQGTVPRRQYQVRLESFSFTDKMRALCLYWHVRDVGMVKTVVALEPQVYTYERIKKEGKLIEVRRYLAGTFKGGKPVASEYERIARDGQDALPESLDGMTVEPVSQTVATLKRLFV